MTLQNQRPENNFIENYQEGRIGSAHEIKIFIFPKEVFKISKRNMRHYTKEGMKTTHWTEVFVNYHNSVA